MSSKKGGRKRRKTSFSTSCNQKRKICLFRRVSSCTKEKEEREGLGDYFRSFTPLCQSLEKERKENGKMAGAETFNRHVKRKGEKEGKRISVIETVNLSAGSKANKEKEKGRIQAISRTGWNGRVAVREKEGGRGGTLTRQSVKNSPSSSTQAEGWPSFSLGRPLLEGGGRGNEGRKKGPLPAMGGKKSRGREVPSTLVVKKGKEVT